MRTCPPYAGLTCRKRPMKTNKEVKISYWAHHLTTLISVTLVLVLMGIISMIWISADRETRRLRERIELSVIMRDSVPEETVRTLAGEIGKSSYAREVRVITKEEALRNWTADTGEDLQELFGVNPLSEEITFGVAADYASAPRIASIKRKLEGNPAVESVSAPDSDMIDSMNRNISRMTVVLGAVAGIMLLISFVLINNTVHLTIYSRRFTIHTMKLVGATPGFIRRPVILDNMLAGALAGVAASALLASVMAFSAEAGLPDIASYVGWEAFGIVCAALVCAGTLLCCIASWIAAGIYLRKDYDQLFR